MSNPMLDCIEFANIRSHFFNVNNLKDLEKVPSEKIINYLKAIHLFIRYNILMLFNLHKYF